MVLHFDGSCILGKVGKGGWVFRAKPGDSPTCGNTGPIDCSYPTCNAAEYAGLAAGLEAILRIHGPSHIKVYGDSRMVIKQMSGQYRVKTQVGKPTKPYTRFYYRARLAADQHRSIEWNWIPREQNAEADRAAE